MSGLRLATLADLRAPASSSGGKRAVARALAELEARPDEAGSQALLDEAWACGEGRAVGLTGPPGVGKSTLTGALVAGLRAAGSRVAVAAVDPSSRASGGAILGDRTRIEADPADAGVFVRSFAARDRLGGLSEAAVPAVTLFRALYDVVLVETVGAGQSETDVADLVDLVLLCVQPGSGDALQFMKAGVMEIPDLAVVTKSDLGQVAARAAADLGAALALAVREGEPPQVLSVSAKTGDGLDALVGTLLERLQRAGGAGLARRREAQARAWLRQALTARFGREGWAALGDHARLRPGESPFARERAAAGLLRARLAAK